MIDILTLEYIMNKCNVYENFIFDNDDDDDDEHSKISLFKFLKRYIFRFKINIGKFFSTKWYNKQKKKSNKTLGYRFVKYLNLLFKFGIIIIAGVLSLYCNKNSTTFVGVFSFIFSLMFPFLYILKYILWNNLLGYSCIRQDNVQNVVQQVQRQIGGRLRQKS